MRLFADHEMDPDRVIVRHGVQVIAMGPVRAPILVAAALEGDVDVFVHPDAEIEFMEWLKSRRLN